MAHLNVEIKAKCDDIIARSKIRRIILREKGAYFNGFDHQIDTYFNVAHGRLKLREGNIENYLIFYERENQSGPKESNVTLLKNKPNSPLKTILSGSLGVLAVIEKTREIYFIDNVKFHIDRVGGLGSFIEIEAIDKLGTIGKEELERQCFHYLDLFGIESCDLVARSYSDLVLDKTLNTGA